MSNNPFKMTNVTDFPALRVQDTMQEEEISLHLKVTGKESCKEKKSVYFINSILALLHSHKKCIMLSILKTERVTLSFIIKTL